MASEDDKCQALVQAEMRVSRAQAVREETELIMKPYANWEEYLMPAPLSVAILGQLIFISAGQGDFSINKNSPPNGFKYINYPESFRACLCQVSNEGWHAFNEAHVNMDRIRLLTASIPGRMKLIVQTLFQEGKVVNAMLPGQLKSMKSTVRECTTLAEKVKDKYKNMISLIQELLEACLNAKTGHEKELEEVQTALKQAKIREETAKKTMKMVEEFHNKMKTQTEDSFDQYKKAMDDIPSGWEATAMAFVEGLGNTVTTIIGCFAALKSSVVGVAANLMQGKFGESTEDGPSSGSDTPNSESQSPLSAMKICSLSSMMLYCASGLKDNVVKQNRINLENVYDKKTEQVKTNWVKKAFSDLRNNIDKEENCQPKQKALDICIAGIDICELLEHMATTARTGKEEERGIVKKIEALYQQAAAFDSYSKGFLRAPSFTPKAPNMAKCQQELKGLPAGVRNAHLKVEQSREMYKATQEHYQKSFENFKKQNEELAEILCLIEECKVKEIDFEDALKMLREGLNTMGKITQQWEKMIQFFEMISNIIDTFLSKKINDFLKIVSDVQKIEGYSSMLYVKDTVYNHVFSASNVANLVHMIAETYTVVSAKHLMDRISSLGTLLALEPRDPEFNSKRNAFRKGCEEAHQAIYNTVIQKKEEFDRNLEARMKTIDREIRAALPPISVAEEKMIEKAVQDGRKELTALEEDQFV